MKAQIYTLTLILTLLKFSTSGQAEETTLDRLSDQLANTWYLDWQNSADTLKFSSTPFAPMGWGERIEIYANGDFVDAYSSKCGNDSKFHNDKGKWTLDAETMIFKTTVPIDYREKVYKIEKLSSTQLILAEPPNSKPHRRL